MRVLTTVVLAGMFAIAAACGPARAWGPKAHFMINNLAASTLPATVPAFMRTPAAIAEITYLGLELDLLKGSGDSWDSELDPGHYLDIISGDQIEGGAALSQLPLTREAYDTTLRSHGTDEYKVGYLPYSIVQGWEQLRMVFAYWRVDSYEATHAPSARLRAVAATRARTEQQLVLRDAGVWGHYVADASQPLHVTVHFNGWGKYPNPQKFSMSSHLHDLFETDFVNRYIVQADVSKRMKASSPLPATTLVSDATILHEVERYLAGSNGTVIELYQIEKTGGFNRGSPQARAFVADRIAFGASELRKLMVWAWQDSLNQTIGDDFPQKVRDIVQGKAQYKGLSATAL